MDKEFEYIRSKVVTDTDGFLDDYTMYKRLSDGKYIMIFGDSEVYTPDNTEPDVEFDTRKEADEWFDHYESGGEGIDPEDLDLINDISFDDITEESSELDCSKESIKEGKIDGEFSSMAGQIGLHTCEELEDFLEREGYVGALEELKSIMLDYLTNELNDLDFVAKENKSITEETIKKHNGKWTNRGKDGQEHGEFDTKEEADAQRKAMFARGFKG